ncbi:hypothetical protein ACFW20_14315 [Streptomyces nigra]|uniref:hypothetical protein n=1 Tax=Streptomyces TaxID=1883 RepID=UPI0015F1B5AC|nr:hypothetical protein [Streptomyces sp. M7]
MFQNIRIHGSVRGFRAVLESVDVGLQEVVLEVTSRMNGDDLVHLAAIQLPQAQADHVGQNPRRPSL